MSKAFSEKMEQEYYDERFLQEAAKLVDSNLLEELNASQSIDVDKVWLQNVRNQTQKSIAKKQHRRNVLVALRRIGRCAAIFLLSVCLLFGGVYVTVDAAREKINNYFFGNRNSRNAIVLPVYWNTEDFVLIPIDWTCPIYPTWIPEEYSLAASGTQLDRYWWLVYNPPESILHSICIYIWDNTYKPAIDMEFYEVVDNYTIQGVPATVFHDPKNGLYSLIMVKNDYTIQIAGGVAYTDILQIAESMEF